MLITNFAKIEQSLLNQTVVVAGFVNTIRDHGGLLFVDLRSFEGTLQTVINPQTNQTAFEIAQELKGEFVIEVTGTLLARTGDTVNSKILNGDKEVLIDSIKIISKAKTLPFDPHSENLTNEELRLKYRYLDLRRKDLQDLMIKKHKFFLAVRNYFDGQGFVDVSTPILANSSPEGARDFLVPSRLHPGQFYALPQAPQQFKQLLMVGGFEKYFQIAPCFRDEDPRSDRHPGDFYQFDAEVAYATDKEIYDICWDFINNCLAKQTTKKLYPTMDKLTYDDAMNHYGSDKPDLRIYQNSEVAIIKNLGWLDAKEMFVDSGFTAFEVVAKNPKAKVQALVVKGAVESFTRSDLDKIQEIGRGFGLPGIAYFQYTKDEIKSPLLKFFTNQQELLAKLTDLTTATTGDLVLFLANDDASLVYKAQNAMRKHIATKLKLIKTDELRFVWIDSMPFYEADEKTSKIEFGHNPFGTFRVKEGQDQLQTLLDAKQNGTLLDLRAVQYDIACNGYEVLSGGQRNSNPEVLLEAFLIAGYSKEEVQTKFGHMLEAYSYGAPYHAGFAWGAERLLMIFNDIENIREVIAFPKNGQGMDLVMGSPSTVRASSLKELGITI
jgi:aspartyl-tRNA synthetase